MAASDLQDAVKAALDALYHCPDDAVRTQADRWLQDFQRTIDAWQVADNLLHDSKSNIETMIFCSQTLRTKVQRDFEELPSEAFCSLRDSLYILLRKLASGPAKVRTQICIAVAALAVHVASEDWGGGGILHWLKDEIDLHPEWIPSFLEMLIILPQEALSYKIAVRPERRRQFEKELISSVEIVFDLLTSCLNKNNLIEQVLEAFASWLRLTHGISAATLASHPLVHATLSGLNTEQLFEASASVVSELIHYTVADRSGGVSSQILLVQVLVPRVMSLKDQLKDSSLDDEDVKGVARLFADMGDAYVELIAAGTGESLLIVQALLEVASHPEYDIASMTFNFWHNLQLSLIGRDSNPNPLGEPEKIRKQQVFQPVYELLVSMMYARVHYPANYQEFSKEDWKDFERTRSGVGEIFVDAAAVLGGNLTLKILFLKLMQALEICNSDKACHWEPIEAALYSIHSIASTVSIFEAEVMPQVMSLLPKLPRQPQLVQTACVTVGAYAKWLNAVSMELLPPIIETLTSGMNMCEDSAAAAALAFKYVCNECRGKFSGSLDGLLHIYHQGVTGGGGCKLSQVDVLDVVEALSMVVSELSMNRAKEAMQLLLSPVVTPLQELVNQGSRSMQHVPSYHLIIHIDRLATIFRCSDHAEAVADAVQSLWPLFKAIFECRGWDMRTMEALSRTCRYAVKAAGNLIGSTIGAMLEEIKILYKMHNQPCFLYLSSEVVKKFGSDPSCTGYLGNLVETLFSHTTENLKALQDFTTRPDIVDDCFLLASRCIRYCPHIFFSSTNFPSLISCAVVGITVQHREACMSILNFCSDVLHLANSQEGCSFRAIIDGVIFSQGADLTRVLIAALTGALPSSRIEEVTNVLVDLARTYDGKVIEWAKSTISRIPSTALTEIEQLRFINALIEASSGACYSDLIAPIEELSDVCRRNRTVQEIVQGALKPSELCFLAVPS